MSREAPDLILHNGDIRTMDAALPHAEALALQGGRIQAVGKGRDILPLRSAATTVLDLKGCTAMPGIVDAHCHPAKGAIADLFSCKFEFSDGPEEIARKLQAFAAKLPGSGWIIGGRWDSNFFDRFSVGSPKRWLDRYCPGRPVYLRDDSGHNGWANSAALEQLAINRNRADPPGGKIGRDAANGEPDGLLFEAADVAARAQIPDWSSAQYLAGVEAMTRIANAYGITGVTDADATEPLLRAYQEADRAGKLTLHVAAAISTPYGHRVTPLDYDHLEVLRDRYRSAHVDTRFAKIYLDGVPTGARTAAMLEPYVAHEEFPDDYRGEVHVDAATLGADIAELERRGFTVKLHTAGDGSVRTALDAIEAAHRISGRSDLRHELAHAGFVHPADLPRFARLNVVADLSPYIWFPSAINDAIVSAVGERGRWYWPIRDFLDGGTPLLAGSDWPAAVASMDPWIGIETMLTRQDPSGRTPGTLWAEQAISLGQALKIFTIDGARALRRDHVTGSLVSGKSADLIVLDRNLFQTDPTDLADTRVMMTLFEGRIAHER